MMGFIYVALGGAIGAMFRYSIGFLPFKGAFPLITLLINILGAFAIGLVAGMAENREVSPGMILFLKTGVCGGFTTFSTFSLESYNLIVSDKPLLAGTYIILSVTLCLLGIFCGLAVTRRA